MRKRLLRIIVKVCLGFMIVIITGLTIITVLSTIQKSRVLEEVAASIALDGKTIQLDEIELFYREYGADDSEVILMVHGFLGSSFDYMTLASYLADDYRVILLDLPGFGLSDKPTDYLYSKQQQAETVIGFANSLGLTQFHLVGHSMGGEIAMRVAHTYPERINALILIDSAGLNANNPNALPQFFYQLFVKNYYLQRAGFQSAFYLDEAKSVDQFEAMYYLNVQIPNPIFQAFSRDSDQDDFPQNIENIETETLIIWGEFDTWIPVSAANQLDATLPNSDLIIIENAGHLPFVEHPQLVAAEMMTFLQQLSE